MPVTMRMVEAPGHSPDASLTPTSGQPTPDWEKDAVEALRDGRSTQDNIDAAIQLALDSGQLPSDIADILRSANTQDPQSLATVSQILDEFGF